MAFTNFTGRDVVTHFKDDARNTATRQFQIDYVCDNRTVTHYVPQAAFQEEDADGNRVYQDSLTFEENLDAGLTRQPLVKLRTQRSSGKWSDWTTIEAYNPAPDVPPIGRSLGIDWVNFTVQKPDDADFAGFCIWADTQTPVRRDQVTTRYVGPNTSIQLKLAPDTDYYVEYGAFDAFGMTDLQTGGMQLHTLSEGSVLVPFLQNVEADFTGRLLTTTAAIDAAAKAYGDQAFEATTGFQAGLDATNGAFAQERTRVNAMFDEAAAGVQEAKDAVANSEFARAALELSLIAKFEDFEGAINVLNEVLADADGVLSQQITDVSARLDKAGGPGITVEQAFQAQASTIEGIRGQYSVRINNQGKLTGFGLMSDENQNSEFAVLADRFVITDGNTDIIPFQVVGGKVIMHDVEVDKLKAGAIDFAFTADQRLANSGSGYQVMPGGLIIQWGQVRYRITDEVPINVTFPIPFPNSLMAVNATPYINLDGGNNLNDLWMQTTNIRSNSGITFFTQAATSNKQYLDGFDWMAFGF